MQRIQRAEAHREIDKSAAIEASPRQGLSPGTCVDTLRIVRTDGSRAFEPNQAAFQVALQPEGAAHREINEWIDWIEFKAARSEAPRQRDLTSQILRIAHEGRLEVDEGKTRVGAREAGIPADRLLEQRGRCGIISAIEAVHVLKACVIGRPGIEIFGHREARQCRLVERDLDFQSREDLRSYVLAYL